MMLCCCSKASEFQAQPLPSFPAPALPSSTKCLTEPAPFNLSTENRGAVKAEKWGQKVHIWRINLFTLTPSTKHQPYLIFIAGSELNSSGGVQELSSREELAKLDTFNTGHPFFFLNLSPFEWKLHNNPKADCGNREKGIRF